MIKFSDLIIIYCLYASSVILHELFHVIFAKFFNIKIYEMKIGEDYFAIRIKRVSISPLIISGYVEFSTDDLVNISKLKCIFLYLSGCIANIILIIISLFLLNKFEYSLYLIIINAFAIIISLIPVEFLRNDCVEMRKILKSKELKAKV